MQRSWASFPDGQGEMSGCCWLPEVQWILERIEDAPKVKRGAEISLRDSNGKSAFDIEPVEAWLNLVQGPEQRAQY